MLNDYVLELCAKHDWHTSAACPKNMSEAPILVTRIGASCYYPKVTWVPRPFQENMQKIRLSIL